MTSVPVTQSLPSVPEVRGRIGCLLRELHVARRLLAVAKLAEQYREVETAATSSGPKQGAAHVG